MPQRGDLVAGHLRHTQEEIDYYWQKLSQGGDEKAQQCGSLKDEYGASWQIIAGAFATRTEPVTRTAPPSASAGPDRAVPAPAPRAPHRA